MDTVKPFLRIRRFCFSPNSGMCSCTWTRPFEMRFKKNQQGTVYLERCTDTELMWWIYEERK